MADHRSNGVSEESDGEPPDMIDNPEAAEELGRAVIPGMSQGLEGSVPMAVMEFIQQEKAESLLKREKQQESQGAAHKFWDTQPVPRLDATVTETGPLEKKTIAEVRQEPYNMPAGFEWSVVDITDTKQEDEVYHLLNENYVEDDDNMFRFDYSRNFLKWALTPPGYSKEFHLGVRNQKTGKLFGFISGIPATIRAYEDSFRTVEINFLCVHKKLRHRRLAPVLIKEITRRVNLDDIWQAVYTAGVHLPKPVACCRYYHRSLNPKKLIEVGFSRLVPRMTMARTIKLYRVSDTPAHHNLREMTQNDVPSACALLQNYLSKFKLAVEIDEAEFAHWLLPRTGVVDSFVLTDGQGVVTDMCSFYHLPSTIIKHPKHGNLFAAYSFYNVATSMSLKDLMKDALVLARNRGMDVFNALNLMENEQFLADLMFGVGDGKLRYYLYNWQCPEMTPQQTGLVLL